MQLKTAITQPPGRHKIAPVDDAPGVRRSGERSVLFKDLGGMAARFSSYRATLAARFLTAAVLCRFVRRGVRKRQRALAVARTRVPHGS